MGAIDEARKVLRMRAAEPRVKMLGLSDDLLVILGALEELEQRVGLIASITLHKHYWPGEPMHEASWRGLAIMSDHARALYNIGTHDSACTCGQCALRSLSMVPVVDTKAQARTVGGTEVKLR